MYYNIICLFPLTISVIYLSRVFFKFISKMYYIGKYNKYICLYIIKYYIYMYIYIYINMCVIHYIHTHCVCI